MAAKVQVNLRMSAKLVRQVEKIAAAERRNFSEMIRLLLEDAITECWEWNKNALKGTRVPPSSRMESEQ